MRSKFSVSRVVASLIVATAVAAISPSAFAFGIRYHYSDCLDNDATTNFRGGGNNSAGGTLTLLCPVSDNDNLTRWSTNTIHVYYEDLNPTANVWASRCLDYSNATGGICGTFTQGATGLNSVTVPNSPAGFAAQWSAAAAHFAYITVSLPAKSGANLSRLKGYYTAN